MNLTKELDYKKRERKYVNSNIKWDSFDDIENYFREIVGREINNNAQFYQLIFDFSENNLSNLVKNIQIEIECLTQELNNLENKEI